jgi:excisionase family DNA binding protein
MKPKFAKVREIADRFRVSVDAVYLWIREGQIPDDCVVRIGGTVRVDEAQFEQRLRAGQLYRSRGRKRSAASEPEDVSTRTRTSAMADDNFTTTGQGPRSAHRWTSETGKVQSDHPFSPEMVSEHR